MCFSLLLLLSLSLSSSLFVLSHNGVLGHTQNAFKSYVRTRDYCTTPKHITTMCLNAVRVAVEMGNFMHVSNYVSKAEQTPGTKVRQRRRALLVLCCGVASQPSRAARRGSAPAAAAACACAAHTM